MSHSHRARRPRPHALHRAWRACALAALAACTVLHAGDAGAATSALGVTALVLARTRVEMTTAPAVLAVSAADVQRGWVEVSEPVVLTVRSNAARGATLVLSASEDLVRQGVVTGFSDPVGFAAGQATIQLAPQKAVEPVRYLLNVRLLLAAGVQPGEYAFPIRFHSADGVSVSSASR